MTGSADRHVPPPAGVNVDFDDPHAGSLQDVRLSELLAGYDAVTKSHVNATGGLIVVSASADEYGSAEIGFSGGIRLQLFADGSLEEDWRFFATDGNSEHLVIEGGRLALE